MHDFHKIRNKRRIWAKLAIIAKFLKNYRQIKRKKREKKDRRYGKMHIIGLFINYD